MNAIEEREKNVYKAKMAEQARRYNEMVEAMRNIVTGSAKDVELTVEERDLLSFGYKNVSGALRSSYRMLKSIEKLEEQKADKSASENKLQMIRTYLVQIEDELRNVCLEILQLLELYLIPCRANKENELFYLKMKGDYLRYLAEIAKGSDHHKDAVENALTAYKVANKIAMNDFAPTHPIRLGLALNIAVFYYEIANCPDRACLLAKAAFEDAYNQMNTVEEDDDYQAASLILDLLRNNLTLWTSTMS